MSLGSDLLAAAAATDKDLMWFLGQVAALVTAVSIISGALMWLVWPRLKAFLQRELIDVVQDTHKQVKENGHRNDEPTLKDDVRDLIGRVEDLSGHLMEIGSQVAAHSGRLTVLERQRGATDAGSEGLEG